MNRVICYDKERNTEAMEFAYMACADDSYLTCRG